MNSYSAILLYEIELLFLFWYETCVVMSLMQHILHNICVRLQIKELLIKLIISLLCTFEIRLWVVGLPVARGAHVAHY
jgi:hypothetical protein